MARVASNHRRVVVTAQRKAAAAWLGQAGMPPPAIRSVLRALALGEVGPGRPLRGVLRRFGCKLYTRGRGKEVWLTRQCANSFRWK